MAENTPESDLGSIECFQNYTAPEVFIQGLAGIVDQQDVESMIRAQKQMLQRFEKTNEMLTNCNTLCVTRLKMASAEFKKHTQLLIDMRKDLDNIFKRIHELKRRANAQYPEAFSVMEALKNDGNAEGSQSLAVSNDNEEIVTDENDIENSTDDVAGGVSLKRANSSSSDSANVSHNDSSPYTSDTG